MTRVSRERTRVGVNVAAGSSRTETHAEMKSNKACLAEDSNIWLAN